MFQQIGKRADCGFSNSDFAIPDNTSPNCTFSFSSCPSYKTTSYIFVIVCYKLTLYRCEIMRRCMRTSIDMYCLILVVKQVFSHFVFKFHNFLTIWLNVKYWLINLFIKRMFLYKYLDLKIDNVLSWLLHSKLLLYYSKKK